MSFEREKTDENIDRKYEDSYNIDFMMMRKQYITLNNKTGKFRENPKKLVFIQARTQGLLVANWRCITGSVDILTKRGQIVYKH